MPFLREWPQRLRQRAESAHLQCWLAAFSNKTRSFDADEITDVEQVEKFNQVRANFFCVDVNLNAPGRIAQVEEMAFAHVAMRGDAPRRAKSLPFLELLAHLRDRSAYVKTGAERLNAFRAERVELFAPQRDQFVFVFHRGCM